MNEVKYQKYYTIFCLLVSFVTVNLFAQNSQTDITKGENLFNSNCVACHKLDSKFIGPALKDVEKRRTKEWLHKWIKNSTDLIKSGDKDAKEIFEQFNKVPMISYEGILSDADIDNVLAYIANPPASKSAQDQNVAEGANSVTKVDANKNYTGLFVFISSIVILIALFVILFKANRMLKNLAKANNKEEYLKNHPYYPLWNVFLKNKIITSVVFLILFFSSTYGIFGYLMQIGIDQGYQPIQPIHYSHKIHAGDNQIDCKYCHSASRTSKTAGIPSLNVCMNCHKAISEYNGVVEPEKGLTKQFYDAEIKKLYDAVGWDPKNMQYTGVQKPVEWKRIHNLPDHVYFNHSQHVTVAGVACQQCHGAIQEMEVVQQFAPLTMGWCIQCHKDTQIDNANPYYQNYKQIHENLAKKYGVEKLTIAQIGGLECGKCHY